MNAQLNVSNIYSLKSKSDFSTSVFHKQMQTQKKAKPKLKHMNWSVWMYSCWHDVKDKKLMSLLTHSLHIEAYTWIYIIETVKTIIFLTYCEAEM